MLPMRKLRHRDGAQLLVEATRLVVGSIGMQTLFSDSSWRWVLPWVLGVRLKPWWQLDMGEGRHSSSGRG